MPDYRQDNGSATAWRRCNKVIIDNPLNATGEALFFEEDVISMGGRTVKTDVGLIRKQFDPSAVIYLRDPTTGDTTGAYTTHGNLYQILYSLYMQEAAIRDAQNTQ